MTKARYNELMSTDVAKLTEAEVEEGWHFCNEFDGLLIKGNKNIPICGQSCVDAEMKGYELE